MNQRLLNQGDGSGYPPNISMVIYGVAASQSIADLFIAEFIPGVMLAPLKMQKPCFKRPRYLKNKILFLRQVFYKICSKIFYKILDALRKILYCETCKVK